MTDLIDTHALQAITALQRPGKPDLLQQIVALFESESPKNIAAILDGLAAGDVDSVRNAAHTLKSSSAYLGAVSLTERCRDIERAARENDIAACTTLSDGLSDLFAASCAELLQHGSKAA